MPTRKMWVAALCALAAVLTAQSPVSQPGWGGLSLQFMAGLESGGPGAATIPGAVEVNGERVSRIVKDQNAKTYLGYDVVAERAADGRLRVRLEPLSLDAARLRQIVDPGWKGLQMAQYPAVPELRAGQTIAIDLLENPTTGQKIVDYVSVSRAQGSAPTQKAQTPPAQQPPSAQQEPDQPLLRITVNRVYVDAIVTDDNGRAVKDLKAADFEIRQDGKKHNPTVCEYVPLTSATPAKRPSGPVPPKALRPGDTQRSIAIVVDNGAMSFGGMVEVRRALAKFLEEELQPADLVGVFGTARDVGVMQQFTADPRRLRAAVDAINWDPAYRWDPMTKWNSFAAGGSINLPAFASDEARSGMASARLLAIARGLRDLPGHKSLILFAERDWGSYSDHPELLDPALTEFVDLANRASMTVYAVGVRGEGIPGMAVTAATRVQSEQPSDPNVRVIPLGERINQLSRNQPSVLARLPRVRTVADLTGGLFRDVSNDLSDSLRSVMNDQQGYYMLAYAPDPSTFDPVTGRRKFHQVSVRVKRSGLKVRSHSGFLGVQDQPPAPVSKPASALVAALINPFGAAGIETGITAQYLDTAAQGPIVTTLVHIRTGDLTFQNVGARREARGEIALMLFNPRGVPVDQTASKFRVIIQQSDWERALAAGLLYTLTLPVKPGAYTLRAAVRDDVSGRVGTAGEFVAVPDLKSRQLAVSGILLQTPAPAGLQTADLRGASALRIFHSGETLVYGYQVLNATLTAKDPAPKVETVLRLFRDGVEVLTGKPTAVAAGPDPARLLAGGDLAIGENLPPGEYVLQIIATDMLADAKNNSASQWVSFQVTP